LGTQPPDSVRMGRLSIDYLFFFSIKSILHDVQDEVELKSWNSSFENKVNARW
jgi:hypothetical protein